MTKSFPTYTDIRKKYGLERGGTTQTFFTQEIKRRSDPYTPMRSGLLTQDVSFGPQREYIRYKARGEGGKSYAQFQWHGWLMVSPSTGSAWAKKGEQKVMASPMKKLDWQDGVYRGGDRGHYWVYRMWQVEGDQIVKAVEKFMTERANK